MQLEEMVSVREETAYILYLDIVRYSLIPPNIQSVLYTALQTIVCETNTYQRCLSAHTLLSRPTGDGVLLLFFDTIESPAQCALEIAQALRDRPDFTLRMGIHCGNIYRMQDLNGMPDVAGDGVNTAQRIMSCGDAGHILVSSAAADGLNQIGQWPSMLRYLGVCSVKHEKRVALWNLCSHTVGNPRLPQTIVDAKMKAALEVDRIAPPTQRKSVKSRTMLVSLNYLLVMGVSMLPLLFFAHILGMSTGWEVAGVALSSLYVAGLIAYIIYSSAKSEER